MEGENEARRESVNGREETKERKGLPKESKARKSEREKQEEEESQRKRKGKRRERVKEGKSERGTLK